MDNNVNYRGNGGAVLDEGKGSLNLNGISFGAPKSLRFIESIYTPYRYGTIEISDIGPVIEMTTLYSITEEDDLQIKLKNAMDDGDGISFPIGIYNSKYQPSIRQNLMQKNLKTMVYEIAEIPMFNKMTESPVRKSYVNMTAAQMIKDILETFVFTGDNSPSVEIMIQGEDKPVIKNFISPYWNVKETIEYLAERHEKGPLVIFPYMDEGENKYVISTIDSLVSGTLGNGADILVKIVSETKKENIMRPDYKVRGPNVNSRLGELQGETIIHYDYFCGTNREDYGKDIGDEDASPRAKYSFTEGVDEYSDSEERYNKSFIAGNYKEGLELYRSGILGRYSFFKKSEFSRPDHMVRIDLDEREEVEAKMRSRFHKALHDQLIIEATLIPHSGITIGKKYKISLPSAKKTYGSEPDYNESLSGEWLLVQLTHSSITREDSALQYVLVGSFVRAGLEKQEHLSLSSEVF